MKKIISLVLIVSLVIGLNTNIVNATSKPGLKIMVDNKIVAFPDAQPFIDENSRTLVPIRFIAEKLGAKVEWDQPTKTAIMIYKGKTIKQTIGEKQAIVNGAIVKLDTKAVLKEKDGKWRTLVPLRFVSEIFGTKVEWENAIRTVKITIKKESKPFKLTKDDIKKIIELSKYPADKFTGCELTKDGEILTYDWHMNPHHFKKCWSGDVNPQRLIYGYLMGTVDMKGYSALVYVPQKDDSKSELFMAYSENPGYDRRDNYYYSFAIHKEDTYNAKRDVDPYEEWKGNTFSDRVNMMLHVKWLYKPTSLTAKIEPYLIEKLRNTLKIMFPEHQDIGDYVVQRYIDWKNTKETKMFGNIQIDSIMDGGFYFFFTFR